MPQGHKKPEKDPIPLTNTIHVKSMFFWHKFFQLNFIRKL